MEWEFLLVIAFNRKMRGSIDLSDIVRSYISPLAKSASSCEGHINWKQNLASYLKSCPEHDYVRIVSQIRIVMG